MKSQFTSTSNLKKKKPTSASEERKWLKKHGKGNYIKFDDRAIRQLRECFNSLDEDGSGSISVDELEDPLIALGLAESREQVEQIVEAVDDDESGQIEFDEFLTIVKTNNTNNDEKGKCQKAIHEFFVGLKNNYKKGAMNSEGNMPFRLYICFKRRKKILAALMEKDGSNSKKEGERVLKAYSRQLAYQHQKEIEEKGELLSTKHVEKENSNVSFSKMPDPETGLMNLLKNLPRKSQNV